jgi:transcriptional regulator with XRE-family HTH domain
VKSVGRRVAMLRTAHEESLREAAIRTGVSHTTIARIEQGAVTGSFHKTLQKIAQGYGVKIELLLTGRDPARDFKAHLQHLRAEDRYALYFISSLERTKMVLDFMLIEYGNEFSQEQLAHAIGIDETMLEQIARSHTPVGIPDAIVERFGEAIARTTGIPLTWFTYGSLGDRQMDPLPDKMVSDYVTLIKKAAKANIQPQMLERAIDLLITKKNT